MGIRRVECGARLECGIVQIFVDRKLIAHGKN